MTIACTARFIEGKLQFHTSTPTETATVTILPNTNSPEVVIPAPSSIPNSQVYKADGSPDFGVMRFRQDQKIITHSVVQPADNTLQDLPHGHDFVISVNAALQTFHWFCDPHQITFVHIPYDANKPADITIKMDPTDPIFVQDKNVMAYCHYPNTTPPGSFTCVINSTYLYSEDGKFNFANNINQTLRHELGHGIGCVHTTDPNDIMFPFYHNSVIPTKTDIFQYQNMYGKRNLPNWVLQNWYEADRKLLEFLH